MPSEWLPSDPRKRPHLSFRKDPWRCAGLASRARVWEATASPLNSAPAGVRSGPEREGRLCVYLVRNRGFRKGFPLSTRTVARGGRTAGPRESEGEWFASAEGGGGGSVSEGQEGFGGPPQEQASDRGRGPPTPMCGRGDRDGGGCYGLPQGIVRAPGHSRLPQDGTRVLLAPGRVAVGVPLPLPPRSSPDTGVRPVSWSPAGWPANLVTHTPVRSRGLTPSPSPARGPLR